ncbi:MAG: hypothetical protein WD848_03925 [Dehalococcoidia bacterium]
MREEYRRLVLILPLMIAVVSLISACATESTEPPPEAPEEFAVFLVEKAAQDEWEAIQELLTDDFRDLDVTAMRRGLELGGSLSGTIWPRHDEPDEWHVEQMGDIFIVRVTEFPQLALNLRQDAEGQWALDPGPYALSWARLLQDAPEDASEELEVDLPVVEKDVMSGESQLWVQRRFMDEVVHTNSTEDGISEVTLRLMLPARGHASIPIEGLNWRAGQIEGTAEVVWTTAILDIDALSMPNDEDGSAVYLVSLQMEDVPDVDIVEVQVNQIIVDDSTLSVHYRVPTENYPQLVE